MKSPKAPSPMGWRGLPQNRPRRRTEADRRHDAQLAQQRRVRSGMVFACITAICFVLAYRFFYWQVLQQEELQARLNQPMLEPATTMERGTIRDRNGYLLATDSVSYKFGISPNICCINGQEPTARKVAEITRVETGKLLEIMQQDIPYTMITESLPYTVGQQLVEMQENAFVLEPVLNRTYPGDSLGAHLLGFVNAERRGLAGVEMYYDELLSGESNIEHADGPPAEEIKLGARPFTPSRNGVDLILTIDRAVQFMVEQELQRAVDQYQATGGSIVVMEPRSGDLLAMASLPKYNPETYTDYLDTPKIFLDPAVSKQFEPGSIFKIITVAAALDAGIVSPNSVFDDSGVWEAGGRIIRNWDRRAHGPVTVTEILGHSLNTGTAWLSFNLGAERFYRYLDSFGFGRPTGVDLSSEATGTVKRPGDGMWHPSDLGTNAFGQGIAVTPLQMISAAGSLLNDGKLMQPRIVRAIVNHGHIQERPVIVRGHTVSREIADQMQRVMVEAVEIETDRALIEGYRVGGKTGTAQVPIPGGYHSTDTIASFIGYAPADEPAFIILIKLDRPRGEAQWGSRSAAPTFQRLATRLLHYYNIPPDSIRMAMEPAAPSVDAPPATPVTEVESATATPAAPPPEPTPVIASP